MIKIYVGKKNYVIPVFFVQPTFKYIYRNCCYGDFCQTVPLVDYSR